MAMRSRQKSMNGFLHLLGMALLGLGLIIAGCANVKPFEPPETREIANGPGLFTGSKGAFVLSRDIGADPAKGTPDAAQEVEAPSKKPDVPETRKRTTPPL